MKKLFWVAVGVGITVLVVVKGKELLKMATPQGVADQAVKVGRSLETRIADFVDTVSENMAAREAEIREALDMDAPER
ncbi:hypothetical protein [Propionicicella superfundia]|uniref:hypothetical protein n=1 Tax=Propionicicella superfundia TaxID=348582 RepID=UPI0003F8469E|nr:hypothetical protein [Propionicicella superfundia]